MAAAPPPNGPPLQATISWAVFPYDAEDAFGLMMAADRRLYQRKRSGRHRIAGAAPALA